MAMCQWPVSIYNSYRAHAQRLFLSRSLTVHLLQSIHCS